MLFPLQCYQSVSLKIDSNKEKSRNNTVNYVGLQNDYLRLFQNRP